MTALGILLLLAALLGHGLAVDLGGQRYGSGLRRRARRLTADGDVHEVLGQCQGHVLGHLPGDAVVKDGDGLGNGADVLYHVFCFGFHGDSSLQTKNFLFFHYSISPKKILPSNEKFLLQTWGKGI